MSKKYFFTILTLACILVQSANSFAQEEDFQSWNNISVSKEIVDDLNVNFKQEVRLFNNATDLKDYITVIGANYRLNKYAKFGALYRLTVANDFDQSTSYEHRWYADAALRYRKSRFILGYRFRYQLSYDDFTINNWSHIRNRFSVKYDIPKSKILPFTEYEFYYALNNPIKNTIEKSRFTMGLEYGVTKYLDLSAYYRIQKRRTYGSKPYNRYILGISASFNF